MTVTYSLNVSKARLLGFAKLLFRWRGSIYKLLYREMAIFCGLYYSLSALYRYVLKESQRTVFEKLALYCEAFTNLIPLSFVLGFYVSIVVSRWWDQFTSLPWPDKPCMLISAYVHGRDERGRLIRRTLARYLSLLSVLSFQAVSTAVKKRFPTLDHVEEAGLMTKEERTVYEEISVVHGKWWIPAQWFTALATRARKEGRIKDDVLLSDLLNELHIFRGNCGMLFSFDWISIPLVYTQVVTLAIYTYFMASVMGRQYLNPDKGYPGYEVDLYIPIFTVLQFFFYMGWLKVAEQLINPFGEDDDDFELNWCLDRNLVISFLIVDEMCQRHPRLVKDQYWDELEPQLPYTRSSAALRTQPHLGSAVNLDINLEEAEFVPMETIMEDDGEENTYSSPPVSPNTELLYPGFPQPDKPTTPSVDETGSQSGLKGFSDFPGSKFLNMLIGHSSSENVAQTPKKEGSIMPTFTLKTPSRKSHTSSQSENMKNQQNVEKDDQELDTMPQMTHDVTGTSVQQSSLIIDIPAGENNSDGPIDQSEFSVKTSKDTETTETVENCKEENKVVTFEEEQNQPTKDVVVEIDSSDSPTDQVRSPYEPILSDESLVVYVESNQSTVSSYAELLGKQ
ncbi:bestrophin-4-like isoform X1 [Limulus polyphemus]|uniref:Bestrophin homolog n=2 Tax=Limulus polyphemus TaxID=6850 RepID=A0ABM1BT61_LIMPO|nr:bestrophin-4-like isoform X1 [Limulus polyphemus]